MLELLFSELSPVAAIVGGVLAQEIIKVISNKVQWIYITGMLYQLMLLISYFVIDKLQSLTDHFIYRLIRCVNHIFH